MNSLNTPLAVHCADFEAVDAAWRMLCHVPDDAFQPVELHLAGKPLYVVRRDEQGNQTSVSACSA